MTSQITKDFQMKSKLRKYADGGNVRPALLGDGMAGRAGGLLSGRGRQVDQAVDAATGGASAPAPAPAPAAPKKGLRSFFGLADGGVSAEGGRVKGPGGRTDDKVGPVMLSDEEYVLPGDTADAIGRDKLDAIRLATHEFKDERKESALRGRTDDVPVDHLADGGNPWIVDSKGTVRPNAFGDAAAGPGYQQPRLPPPQPGTAVGPSAISPGGHRTINMGMVDDVTPRPAQIANNPTAPAAAKTAQPWTGAPPTNPNVGPDGSKEAQAFRKAAGNAPGGAAPAAVTRAEQLGRMAGNATRVGLRVGGGLATTAPLAGFGDYKADTGGVDTSAGGTLSYLTKGEFGNAGTSLSGGLGEALADSGRGFAKTADWAAGLVGAKPDLTGSYDKMITDKLGGYLSLRNPESKPDDAMGPPESAKGPVTAAASALRSDQGPAQPVTPGSYQSRRLSEMGVPMDVQNSNPVVDSATGSTRNFLRTGGTSQYQNLGTYGGNGNIYGKADDPSRPGRINNFVGVGAGASPENEANGSGSGGGGYAGRGGVPQSPLRGPSAPSGGSSVPGVDAAVNAINGRYDRMLKEGRGRAVEFGSDWSQRHGINLETARGRELNDLLGNARTNETSRANAQLTADTSRENAERTERASLLNTLGDMERTRATVGSQAQAAQLKALRDAQKYSDERQDKGEAATNDWIKRRFTSNGLLGKEQFDSGGAAEFTDFLGSGKAMVGPPENRRPLMSLPPQERLAALPDVYQDWSVNEAINTPGGLIGGGRTTNSPGKLVARPATVADLANGLPLSEYLGTKFVPNYDSNVVERTTDRKVRSVEAIAGDDLERKKAIMRNAGKE